jgi:hypothetical protein
MQVRQNDSAGRDSRNSKGSIEFGQKGESGSVGGSERSTRLVDYCAGGGIRKVECEGGVSLGGKDVVAGDGGVCVMEFGEEIVWGIVAGTFDWDGDNADDGKEAQCGLEEHVGLQARVILM